MMFERKPNEPAAVKYADIPPLKEKSIAADFKAEFGRQPTMREIEDVYTASMLMGAR
jgi:hypothetical protein